MANRAELHFPSLTVGVSVNHNVQQHENTQCAKLLVLEKKLIIILHKSIEHYLNVATPYCSPECNRITGSRSSLPMTPQKWLFWLWGGKIQIPKFYKIQDLVIDLLVAAQETSGKGQEKWRRELRNFQVTWTMLVLIRILSQNSWG